MSEDESPEDSQKRYVANTSAAEFKENKEALDGELTVEESARCIAPETVAQISQDRAHDGWLPTTLEAVKTEGHQLIDQKPRSPYDVQE